MHALGIDKKSLVIHKNNQALSDRERLMDKKIQYLDKK